MPVLTVHLSEETYRRLEQGLKAQGISPEEFAASLLRAVANRFEADALTQLAGTIDTSTAEISETALLSEQSLAEDWNRPEEDKAWSHLQ